MLTQCPKPRMSASKSEKPKCRYPNTLLHTQNNSRLQKCIRPEWTRNCTLTMTRQSVFQGSVTKPGINQTEVTDPWRSQKSKARKVIFSVFLYKNQVTAGFKANTDYLFSLEVLDEVDGVDKTTWTIPWNRSGVFLLSINHPSSS